MRRALPLLAATALSGVATGTAVAQDDPSGDTTLERLDASLQSLVETASPAVVRLDVDRAVSLRLVGGSAGETQSPEVALHRFAATESITATGFLMDHEGHVVTTAAALGPGSTQVRVTFATGTERIGRHVGTDEIAGVALVRVKPVEGVEPLVLAGSAPRIGAITVLLGHAERRDPVVRWGLLSGTDRAVGDYDAYLLASVDVRPGDAGGPLLDVRGRVLGMAVMAGTGTAPMQRLAEIVRRVRRTGDPAPTSTFVPAAEMRRIVDDLRTLGRVRRGMLGVLLERGAPLAGVASDGPSLLRATQTNTVVDDVPEGLPAAEAGVRSGDTIVAIDGTPIRDRLQMIPWIQRRAPGTTVTITLRSPEGEERTLDVVLDELPAPPPPPAALFNGLGVRGGEDGLRIFTVDTGCSADQAGIRPGDVIVSISGREVKDEDDYVEIATGPVAHLREVEIRIRRKGEELVFTLK